jgi:hypothetical protein
LLLRLDWRLQNKLIDYGFAFSRTVFGVSLDELHQFWMHLESGTPRPFGGPLQYFVFFRIRQIEDVQNSGNRNIFPRGEEVHPEQIEILRLAGRLIANVLPFRIVEMHSELFQFGANSFRFWV